MIENNADNKPAQRVNRRLFLYAIGVGALAIGVARTLPQALQQSAEQGTGHAGAAPATPEPATPVVAQAPAFVETSTSVATATTVPEVTSTKIPDTATAIPATETSIPTNTVVASPTKENTAAPAATNTAEVKASSTPEVLKSVLKDGDVYYGKMTGPSGELGYLAISYLELDHHDNSTNDPNELLIYSGYSASGRRTFSSRIDEPTSTNENSFKGNDKHAIHIVNARLEGESLSGELMDAGILFSFTKIALLGSGEKPLLDACNNVRSTILGIAKLSDEKMKLEINNGLKSDYVTKPYSLPY